MPRASALPRVALAALEAVWAVVILVAHPGGIDSRFAYALLALAALSLAGRYASGPAFLALTIVVIAAVGYLVGGLLFALALVLATVVFGLIVLGVGRVRRR